MRALAARTAPSHLGRVGLLGTALLHALVIGTVLLAGRQSSYHSPLPAYRVELVAAPRSSVAGDAASPAPAAAPPARAAAVPPTPVPRLRAPAPTATHAPAASNAASPVREVGRAVGRTGGPERSAARPPDRPTALQPTAAITTPAPGASANTTAAPGTGTGPATIRTEGVEFPFPGYLRNLVAQVYRRWHPPTSNADLESEMLFFVHRDGTVTGLQFVRRSGSFAFDLEAQGAVESAARAGAFGPLPPGFGPDLLPVSFFFSPRALR